MTFSLQIAEGFFLKNIIKFSTNFNVQHESKKSEDKKIR